MGYCTGDNREICTLVAHRKICNLARSFFYDQSYKDIVILFHFCELLQGDNTALVQFHVGIHSEKYSEYIRKAESTPDAAAYSCHIAELNADNIF